ncbi:hypothetical protein IAR50_007008 [Cryptococcus sp. DSM 104548]
MPSAAWKTSFRSPSPDTDPEHCLPSQFAASTHANLVHDLDLSLRPDHAELNSTPFTMAKQKSSRKGGKKISHVMTAEERRNGVTSSPPKPSTGRSTVAKSVLNNSTLPFQPQPRKPGPKPAKKDFVQPLLHDDPPKPKSRNKSGPSAAWVDKDGNALPEDPSPRPSILQVLEEKEREEEKKAKKKEAAKEKRKKTAERKKREKEEDDKIQFTLLPKGAANHDEFPIIKALNNQRSLPTKIRPFTGSEIQLNEGDVTRSPQPNALVDAHEVDDLVYGPPGARGGTTAEDAIEIESTPGTTQAGERPGSTKTSPTLVGSAGRSTQRQYTLPFTRTTHTLTTPSSRTTFKPPFKKPIANGISPPPHDYVDPLSTSRTHLSTITQVPSSLTRGGRTMSSGVSKLAYSSPLTGRGRAGYPPAQIKSMARAKNDGERQEAFKDDGLLMDLEEDDYRSVDVKRLERAAEDFHIHPNFQSTLSSNVARPVARRFEPLFPIASKPRLIKNRHNPPTIHSSTPEWSTLPAKRRQDSSFASPIKASKQPFMTGHFRMPASLLPTPKQPAPLSPSSEPAVKSPPREYSKLTLFTPSSKEDDNFRQAKPAYTVITSRGSKFASSAERDEPYKGAGVKGRLTLPPRKTGSSITLGRQGKERDSYPVDQGAGPSKYNPFQTQYRHYDPPIDEDDEDDWTHAWKAKANGNRSGVMGGRDRENEDELEAAEKYVFERRRGY